MSKGRDKKKREEKKKPKQTIKEKRRSKKEKRRTLPVSYHGIIPDTFVDDAAVVVEGRLQEDGTFVAHELLAKCPSKYEAAETAPGGDPLPPAVTH